MRSLGDQLAVLARHLDYRYLRASNKPATTVVDAELAGTKHALMSFVERARTTTSRLVAILPISFRHVVEWRAGRSRRLDGLGFMVASICSGLLD